MIAGVAQCPLKKISDSRGSVMHMLRNDAPHFAGFGEIYFSTVNLGMVKAWKKHLRMTQQYAVPVGRIKLVIVDDRKESATCNKVDVLEIGEGNYCLVRIPPLVWYGFQGVSARPALIANCTDIPHDFSRADARRRPADRPSLRNSRT